MQLSATTVLAVLLVSGPLAFAQNVRKAELSIVHARNFKQIESAVARDDTVIQERAYELESRGTNKDKKKEEARKKKEEAARKKAEEEKKKKAEEDEKKKKADEEKKKKADENKKKGKGGSSSNESGSKTGYCTKIDGRTKAPTWVLRDIVTASPFVRAKARTTAPTRT